MKRHDNLSEIYILTKTLILSRKSHDRKCVKPIKENLDIDPECFVSVFISSFQATAEANNLAALASSKDSYNKNMELVSHSHIIRVIRPNTVELCELERGKSLSPTLFVFIKRPKGWLSNN